MEKVWMPNELLNSDARRRSGNAGKCSMVMKTLQIAAVTVPIIVVVVAFIRLEYRFSLLEEEHIAMKASSCRCVGLASEPVGRVGENGQLLARSELERADFERVRIIATPSDAVVKSSEEDIDSFFDDTASDADDTAAAADSVKHPFSGHSIVIGGADDHDDGDDDRLMRSHEEDRSDDDVIIAWNDEDASVSQRVVKTRSKRHADRKTSRNKAEVEKAPVVKPPPNKSKKTPQPKQPVKSNDVAFHLNTKYSTDLNDKIQRTPVSDAADGHRHLNGDLHYIWWDVPEWSRKSQLYTYNHNSGHITVKQKGVYFVYSQVQYGNAMPNSGYSVMVGHSEDEPRELVRCWSGIGHIPPNDKHGKRYPTCYVGFATALNHHNQSIWIKDLYGNLIGADPMSSYFGIIKLSDL